MYSTAKPKLTHTGDLNEAGASSNFSLSTPPLVLAMPLCFLFSTSVCELHLEPAPVTV